MSKFQTSILAIIPSNIDHQDQITSFIKKDFNSDNKSGNIHWLNSEGQTFKINMIKDLIKQTAFAGYNNQPQFFTLLHIDKATIPAQNALLKTLEEPPPQTQIILTANDTNNLLPTITSRCQILYLSDNSATITTDNFKKSLEIPENILNFFTSPQKTPFSDLIEIAGSYKDRHEAILLIKNIISSLHKKPPSQLSEKNKIFILSTSLEIITSLQQNVNVKLTLENFFISYKKFAI